MKSPLTIQKELLKKEYEKTPLGIAEKKLRKFYDDAYLNSWVIPEETLKQRDVIRTENEKRVMEYVETRQKIDKEWIDDALLDSMSREILLLEIN